MKIPAVLSRVSELGFVCGNLSFVFEGVASVRL